MVGNIIIIYTCIVSYVLFIYIIYGIYCTCDKLKLCLLWYSYNYYYYCELCTTLCIIII